MSHFYALVLVKKDAVDIERAIAAQVAAVQAILERNRDAVAVVVDFHI